MKPFEQNILMKYLPGKTDRDNPEKWLPVWMHLEDTAGIMEKLVNKWLSPNIIKFIEDQLDTGDVTDISKLLAYVHDIGKFTPNSGSSAGNQITSRKKSYRNSIQLFLCS